MRGCVVVVVTFAVCNLLPPVVCLQYDFFPVTYLLPMEYGVFVEDFKRQADKPIWIAKPTGRAQGRGIFLFTDLREVKIWKKASENRGKPKDDDEDDVENYVVQRYITNPYLVGGKKFDLRIYVLVTSFMPLTIWLYRGGFGRFSAFRYHADAKASSLKDVHMHLTNAAVQKVSCRSCLCVCATVSVSVCACFRV